MFGRTQKTVETQAISRWTVFPQPFQIQSTKPLQVQEQGTKVCIFLS